MLRNSYFEQYKDMIKKRTQIEKENSLYNQDLNNIIYSQRPMSTYRIKKLSPKILPIFIDDVMCDNGVNTLLYSSNAHKEIYYYIKQKKSLLNSSLNKNSLSSLFKKKKVLSPLGKIMAERSNLQVINSLKSKIDKFNNSRNDYMEKLRNKQELFLKCQPSIDNKLKKLYYKPINEIRLQGYQRAFKQCLQRAKSDQNFDLPNINLDMNDVYSRLFKNAILNPNLLRNKNSQEKKEKEFQNEINTNNDSKNAIIGNKTVRNIRHKKISINAGSNRTKNKNYYYYSKLPIFNIVNIINSSKGKEFNIRITPRIKKRCWSALSGGPKTNSESEIELNNKNEENKNEEEIDYKELREKNIFNINKSKKKNNINNIILYNTLLLDKKGRGSELIKVKNYRDIDFNTNLHIAVKSNSIKLIKYFLEKKISPNEVNKEGQTPLHFAVKSGNIQIIELLMDNGADKNIKDNKGKKPFDYASKEVIHYFKFENQK